MTRTGSLRHFRAQVKLIAFDFDGVLTDDRVLVFGSGEEAVVCNRSDGLGFDMLRTANIPAVIISTERHAVVSARAAKLKVPVLRAIADKGEALGQYCKENQIHLGSVAFVGNDINDISAMRRCAFPIAVADAHSDVRDLAWKVLRVPGGAGVVREIAENLLGLNLSNSTDAQS